MLAWTKIHTYVRIHMHTQPRNALLDDLAPALGTKNRSSTYTVAVSPRSGGSPAVSARTRLDPKVTTMGGCDVIVWQRKTVLTNYLDQRQL